MWTRCIALSVLTAAALSAQNPIMSAYMPRYSTMKLNLIEAAKAMPADAYSFKLSPKQRAYGEWVDHTAMLMTNMCAAMEGKPAQRMQHDPAASKEVRVEHLEKAAAGCDRVLTDWTDERVLMPVTVNGKPTHPIDPMINLLTNMASHYGNMVGYLRAKDIVPPSTARSMKK